MRRSSKSVNRVCSALVGVVVLATVLTLMLVSSTGVSPAGRENLRPVLSSAGVPPAGSTDVTTIVNGLAAGLKAQSGIAAVTADVYMTTRGAEHHDSMHWPTFGFDPTAPTYLVVFNEKISKEIDIGGDTSTRTFVAVGVLVDAATGQVDGTAYFSTPPDLADLGQPQAVPVSDS
jgi:hypothetical protein